MRQMRVSLGTVCLLIFGMAAPMAAARTQDQGACRQIRAACQGAGFIEGAAREGIGLQIHCIIPIMQARAQPLTARKPLPRVNPQLVADCKASNSRFGRPLPPSEAVAQPLPANGNPPPTYGGRGQAVTYPGQDIVLRPPMPMTSEQRAVISALPLEDQPETVPVKSLPPSSAGLSSITPARNLPARSSSIHRTPTSIWYSATARPCATASAWAAKASLGLVPRK
jgi:hypothetical protein